MQEFPENTNKKEQTSYSCKLGWALEVIPAQKESNPTFGWTANKTTICIYGIIAFQTLCVMVSHRLIYVWNVKIKLAHHIHACYIFSFKFLTYLSDQSIKLNFVNYFIALE